MKHNAVIKKGGVKVYLHSFLIVALDGSVIQYCLLTLHHLKMATSGELIEVYLLMRGN
jgi:hypothetical protein